MASAEGAIVERDHAENQIPLDDLISMTQGAIEPDADQPGASAAALGVTVAEIGRSRMRPTPTRRESLRVIAVP
ncbi:hypothetical protein [Sphingomonas sp. LaA6.9]|uniref:hypothetical protein n=1 Tax=Sphingomonas sp. LaA6.9 TaxID=2919914 RepID=UPI001F4F61C2|nr:hypothetical protein [Sphingomonas sp. LaA6.9]MCJ8157248.1 hypothetical protein [Sphingomonas sp. LaA6.9]